MKVTVRILLFLSLLCSSWRLAAAPAIGQWDFDAGTLAASAGATLGPIQFAGGTAASTQFGSTTTFGIPAVNGTNANVMKFPAAASWQGYDMPTPPTANGGDPMLVSAVNDYTIIFDVLYSTNGNFRSLLQTDDAGLSGTVAYLGINAVGQVGADNDNTAILPAGFGGQLASNTWYRIGFTVSRTDSSLIAYVNGLQVEVLPLGAVDDAYSYSMPPAATRRLFTTSSNMVSGYVNSIQLRDVVLNAGQMQALGGPAASG